MLKHDMIVRSKTKDPETFASVQGFLLSDEMRESIGANLVRLVAKATKKGNDRLRRVTVREAFLTATLAALLERTRVSLSEDEMTRCTNIIFALLPIRRLEQARIADRTVRSLALSKRAVMELQQVLGVRV
jgi:hypothetical protein